jgi:hypothetical protein
VLRTWAFAPCRCLHQPQWRHSEAKRLRGLQVDHQLELVRLLDRDVCGLDAAENFDEEPGGQGATHRVRSGDVEA